MNYVTTQYSLSTRSLDVFLSGCTIRCKGCHNAELWDFTSGKPVDVFEIYTKLMQGIPMIDSVRIMGGEPLDQLPNNLLELVKTLYQLCGLEFDIWLFTGKEMEDIPNELAVYLDYAKCGAYREDLPSVDTDYGFELASNNQYVVDFRGYTGGRKTITNVSGLCRIDGSRSVSRDRHGEDK